MVICLGCKSILTLVNVVRNDQKEGQCTTHFECHNCGAQIRVMQELTKKPSKKFAKGPVFV